MSTIAYRDGVLAADTAAFRGNTVVCGIRKIDRRADGTLVGAVGMAGFAAAFRAWVLNGETGPRPEPGNTETSSDAGLIVRPDGPLEVHEEGGVLLLDVPYYALGAGRDQALGAMFAGAPAQVAIAAAIAHDIYTAGEITVLRR